MTKARLQYVCQSCGYTSSKWLGRCPSCGEWNSLVLTLARGVLTLELNGQVIGERALEPANDRRFGLYHDRDQTAVRVRDIYAQVQRQVFVFLGATLIVIAATSLYLIRSNRQLFARLSRHLRPSPLRAGRGAPKAGRSA